MGSDPRAGETASAAPIATRGPRRFRITVVDGPESGTSIDRECPGGAEIVLGRAGPGWALRDARVSARHAVISFEGPHPRLRDLGSTNGTTVNGTRIVEAFLDDGDRIRVGDTILRISTPATVEAETTFGGLHAQSPEMRRLWPLCRRLAATKVPVVIGGETGTGKDALARALHAQGPRAGRPFVVFDCTATPANLMEASLFGHEKGAFTGANAATRGVFEQADGGTLLIDEIGDLELPLQAKLLRVIEQSEIRRLGSEITRTVDVRLLAATRRDLRKLVSEGKFRDDLYYRLAVATIELPPLRARTGDVEFLIRAFWRELGGDDPPKDLVERLRSQPWPGNVRQLRNAVSREMALGDLASAGLAQTDVAPPGDDPIDSILAKDLPLADARQAIVEELERRYVDRALAETGGDLQAVAERAGVGLRYLRMLRAKLRR